METRCRGLDTLLNAGYKKGHVLLSVVDGKAMTVRLLSLMLLSGILFLPSMASATDKRVALVVGVGAYGTVSPLRNPPNDARLIDSLLKKLGFDTDLVIDPNRGALESAVRRFEQRMEGATVALFFYAGHGMQIDGANYLLPVDAKVERRADLDFSVLNLQTVLKQMQAPGRVNLVFLDACRNNPVVTRSLASWMGTRAADGARGLAREEKSEGTLIAYATDPGDVAQDGEGANSPFTTALAKYIMEPGLEVRQVMTRVRADVLAATGRRQRPWDNSGLEQDFYFTPPVVTATVTALPAPASPGSSSPGAEDGAAELAFWNSVQTSTDMRDFTAYLAQYPQGRFIALARNRLDRLQRDAALPSGTPAPVLVPSLTPKQTLTAAEAPRAGRVLNCRELWTERNSYYKKAGYCFTTPRAAAHFGNEGCQYKNVASIPLPRDVRSRITEINALERRQGCD